MVLVEYGSNNMLRAGEKWSGWLAILIAGVFIEGHYQQYANFCLSTVIPVHASEKQGEIKTTSALTRLPPPPKLLSICLRTNRRGALQPKQDIFAKSIPKHYPQMFFTNAVTYY